MPVIRLNASIWRPAPALAVLLCATLSFAASPPAAAPSDADVVKALLARVEQLESEMKELRGAGNGNAAEASTVEAKPTWPNLRLNCFADLNYHAANSRGINNHFEVGEFDIFLKSRISEHASVLVETVVAANDLNEWSVDIERLIFEYRFNAAFNLEAGRFHTALGYYNNAYHHGTWFQTAANRPAFLRFEDEAGLFPIHSVGVSANGEIPSGALGLRYTVEVANGRAFAKGQLGFNEVQNASENNHSKAVNIQLSARPENLPGLQFGSGVYLDTLSPTNEARTSESIWHNFVAYKYSGWEVLSEYYAIRHAPDGGAAATSHATFAQVAYQLGRLRPYVRYTYQDVPGNDAAYAVIGATGRQDGPTVGIRWDFDTFAALKAQYDSLSSTEGPPTHDLIVQLAFTF